MFEFKAIQNLFIKNKGHITNSEGQIDALCDIKQKYDRSDSENLQCQKHGSDPGQNAQLMTARDYKVQKK